MVDVALHDVRVSCLQLVLLQGDKNTQTFRDYTSAPLLLFLARNDRNVI